MAKVDLGDELDYPSNSHKKQDAKKEVKDTKSKTVKEKHLEKVVNSKGKVRKRTLGSRFSKMLMGDENKGVGEYIIYDVLVPALKDMIADSVKGGIEMMLFGERRSKGVSRDRGRSYVSYNGYYKSDRDRDRRETSHSSRARHDFDDIIINTRGEADEVLSRLLDTIEQYDFVTVADYYTLVDIEAEFTDEKYGWSDLRSATVTRAHGGYVINLPRTQALG